MELLKPGGRLVYSTCSFNPVENESVVAAAIRENTGPIPLVPALLDPHVKEMLNHLSPSLHTAFKIVDASSLLPDLIRAPGLTTWKAAVGKECLLYDSYEDFLAAEETTEEVKERTHATMWPKGDEKELGLEKWYVGYSAQQDGRHGN